MNHIHQIIWNKTLGAWVVASELAKRGKKRGSIRRKALILPLLLYASASYALPTGNELVAGSVTVTTPSAQQMQINQSSPKAIVNWQGFSIAGNESVNIQQPNVGSVLLNRVVGQDASSIQGRLNANGQVYLINPNGVIFSKTAQVDVGGLIASTHALSNQDFLNGKLHFTQNNATGSVINQGQIKTPEGGIVVLIGDQVENSGSISTPKGVTALAAGKTVDLDMQGDGLVEVKITEAAINAQINNRGIIQADGGLVIMTAQAAGQLLNTVINNQGVVEARGLVEKNGKIVLSGGDSGVVQVSGTLDVGGQSVGNDGSSSASSNTQGGNITVSGEQIQINNGAKLNASGDAGGGSIVIGDKQTTSLSTVNSGASIAAQALDHGKAGTIAVLANSDNGTVTIEGQLNASAPKHGDGGSVDTSAAHVKVADTAQITTLAADGKAGTWLIDPTDFTIGSGLMGTVTAGTPSGDISGATLSTALGGGAVTILSSQGSTVAGSGNINVNDAVSWNANTLLTLTASNNVNVNVSITANGATAGIAINPNTANGTEAASGAGTFNLGSGASINLPNVSSSSTAAFNLNGTSYAVINNLGLATDATGGAITLQGIAALSNLSRNFVLGSNIDASATGDVSNPNYFGITGFTPIGASSNSFTGNFNGLGHTISNLTIYRPSVSNVGLFGYTGSGSTISNVGLKGSSIWGYDSVGGLVGWNNGAINNAYAIGNVEGTDGGAGMDSVGGLVGLNNSSISNSYAIGNMIGTIDVGGLVGFNNSGSISNSHAMGSVIGLNDVGGLVGFNSGSINNTYATSSVTGSKSSTHLTSIDYNISPEKIGGLVGLNNNSISNSYATGNVIGVNNVGGLVGYNTDNINTGSIVSTGIISNAYATGSVRGLNGIDTTNNNPIISNSVGGLVGKNNSSGINSVSNAYATGSMTGVSDVGGLVGNNSGIISNTFWDTQSTGLSNGVGIGFSTGVVGKTSADMKQLSTFNNAGWSISGVGGSTAVWRIYDDFTAPLLRSFLTPLTVTANADTKPYDGLAYTGGKGVTYIGLTGSGLNYSYSGNSQGAINAGAYDITPTGLHSDQQGYDISLVSARLTINPVSLTITANPDSKNYDGLAYTGGNGVIYAGWVNNETSSVLKGSLSYGGNSQGAINAGAYDIVPGGLNASNYTITYSKGQLTIVNTPISTPNYSLPDNIAPLATSVIYKQPPSSSAYNPLSSSSAVSDSSVKDSIEDFAGNLPQYCDDSISSQPMTNCQKRLENEHLILPTLKIKNSAGRIKRLQLSTNKQFLSLLLEDGTVRIWDFQRGDQHQIMTRNKSSAVTDISAVNGKDELISIADKAGIGTQDIIISTLDDTLLIKKPDIRHFISSNDGSLLLVSAGADQLSLWNSLQNKQLWQLAYERGTVHDLAMTDNKRYGAVLSRQSGAYVLPADLQLNSLTDAVDIVDLDAGKVIKSLPNVGEQILSMQFKDNDMLQLRLASGEVLDWPIAGDSPKKVGVFAETVITVDTDTKNYVYVLPDGTVRVGDGLGHILLSINNTKNPVKDAKLLAGDKKLLTVMDNGELALWDVASGKKMLRLFSTQQGWTVMDAFGRFDGSEDAMENFSWLANEVDIPLDSFSENYYEPGLLSNVMQNQDLLNTNPFMVKNGITLPPKVLLQIAEQQAQGNNMALQLDIYDRGGGIDKVRVYHNGKIIGNDVVVSAQQTVHENNAEHRMLTLNITPSAGKNTLKVIASNDMGIENSSAELSFDGKTKAYISSLRVLTIGIDHYSDARLNLDYSVTDADSIGLAIKNSSKTTTNKNLYNENATKPKILAELKELSQGVQQDVLVIYFAGHGMALGKEWYFLPYETQMQPTLEKIAATGITATELGDIFKDSKIQHILLMVDSCYSGAGVDAFSKLQNGQHYFTRQLSRSLGITVITAAAKDQGAFELKSLGHGLFTYLMAKELQKNTATQPLTAHGIAENIVKTLPVFSKKMLGVSQDPVAYTKGNDFMLTDALKESSKDSAPVIAPKKFAQ